MAASVLILWVDESTWSIQSVGSIVEPQKVYGDVYWAGDLVKARYRGALYPGVVVAIGVERDELKNLGAQVEALVSRSSGVLDTSALLKEIKGIQNVASSIPLPVPIAAQGKEQTISIAKTQGTLDRTRNRIISRSSPEKGKSPEPPVSVFQRQAPLSQKIQVDPLRDNALSSSLSVSHSPSSGKRTSSELPVSALQRPIHLDPPRVNTLSSLSVSHSPSSGKRKSSELPVSAFQGPNHLDPPRVNTLSSLSVSHSPSSGKRKSSELPVSAFQRPIHVDPPRSSSSSPSAKRRESTRTLSPLSASEDEELKL